MRDFKEAKAEALELVTGNTDIKKQQYLHGIKTVLQI